MEPFDFIAEPFQDRELRQVIEMVLHSHSVKNSRMNHDDRLHANEFAALYETARDLGEQLNLPQLLQAIVDRAAALLAAPGGTIYLYNAEQRYLQVAIRKGSEVPIGTRLELGEGMAGKVAQSRQPMIVDNYQTWEGRSPKFEGIPVTTILQVPMLYGGELVGVLSVRESGDSNRKFNEHDAHLLSLFAAQAAGAVHNARLFAETERRANEFATLYEITRDLTNQRDLSTLLETIVERATKLLSTPSGSIFLYDAKRGDLERVVSKGLPSKRGPVRLKMGEGLAGRVAQTKQPLILGDYYRWAESASSHQATSLSAICQVPMLYRGELIGVLSVSELNAERKFTEEDVHVLSLLAGQAAAAVDNARLLSETQRRVVELETVNRVSTALRVAQSLEEMLPLLLDQALAVLGTDAGVIWLDSPIEAELLRVVWRGWFTRLSELPIHTGDGIAGHVFQTGEPYCTREFLTDPQTRDSTRLHIPPGWGGACVPIRAAEQIIGVIFVSVQLPRELTAEEVRLVTTLAEIAGNAIYRTRLRQSLEESYLETVPALASTLDARDRYTSRHSDRIARLAVAVAREMGLSKEEQERIRFAAYLHDIGKIGIPDAVLQKPGPLNEEEWKLIKKHPVIGAQILVPIQHLKDVVEIVRHHQERFDGLGYPDGLAGEAIPILARILAVVDAYSAMIDDRIYRKGRPHDQAIEELKRYAGTQFDPKVVGTFLRINVVAPENGTQ